MAVIHHTTLTPGKLELLAAWLPRQPWYQPRTATLVVAWSQHSTSPSVAAFARAAATIAHQLPAPSDDPIPMPETDQSTI